MDGAAISEIGEAILDENFPDVDLALRRGRHIDRDDGPWYAFTLAAQSVLEDFYRRYGCELVHRTDGYFYLLPTGERLSRRQLSGPEMVVGQGLALLYLDPKTLESGGIVTRTALLGHLATVMGADVLTAAMGHKRRRNDERVAQQYVRRKVASALRRLALLGFVELLDEEQLRLRAPLMRFAEPVRGSGSPTHALEVLLAKGEVVLGEDALGDEDGDFDEDEPEPEPEGEGEPASETEGARDSGPEGEPEPETEGARDSGPEGEGEPEGQGAPGDDQGAEPLEEMEPPEPRRAGSADAPREEPPPPDEDDQPSDDDTTQAPWVDEPSWWGDQGDGDE